MIDLGQFPHCDMAVIHKPGACKYCDMRSDLQELRVVWGIAFTGEHPQEGEMSCPSDFRRGFGEAGRVWGGNRAVPPDVS